MLVSCVPTARSYAGVFPAAVLLPFAELSTLMTDMGQDAILDCPSQKLFNSGSVACGCGSMQGTGSLEWGVGPLVLCTGISHLASGPDLLASLKCSWQLPSARIDYTRAAFVAAYQQRFFAPRQREIPGCVCVCGWVEEACHQGKQPYCIFFQQGAGALPGKNCQ